METGDPDDYLTLLMLLDHPRANLKAVTVTPGSPHQIGIVRHALKLFNVNIPVGAFNIEQPKVCVAGWHYKAFGQIAPSRDARPGHEVLMEHCDNDTTLLTGAPLKNLGRALDDPDFRLGRWVAQGGFAGDNIIDEADRLPQFDGKITCPTYNFNGDPKSALKALASPNIKFKNLVSKNVCHGVFYDQEIHDAIGKVKDKRLSLQLIHKHADMGKKLHDPLAAMVALNGHVANWAYGEVEVYRERGEWGSRRKSGTKTLIISSYNREVFINTLCEY